MGNKEVGRRPFIPEGPMCLSSTCERPSVSHDVPDVPVMQNLMEGDQ
jgi:hypothetical protein